MIEEEAKTKACPFVGIAHSTLIASGQVSSNDNHLVAKCQGADCMMWRWDGETPKGAPHGYCGIAGKPK